MHSRIRLEPLAPVSVLRRPVVVGHRGRRAQSRAAQSKSASSKHDVTTIPSNEICGVQKNPKRDGLGSRVQLTDPEWGHDSFGTAFQFWNCSNQGAGAEMIENLPPWLATWTLVGNSQPPRDPNDDDDTEEEDEEDGEEDKEPPVVREPNE
jgi:hypothetical protein